MSRARQRSPAEPAARPGSRLQPRSRSPKAKPFGTLEHNGHLLQEKHIPTPKNSPFESSRRAEPANIASQDESGLSGPDTSQGEEDEEDDPDEDADDEDDEEAEFIAPSGEPVGKNMHRKKKRPLCALSGQLLSGSRAGLKKNQNDIIIEKCVKRRRDDISEESENSVAAELVEGVCGLEVMGSPRRKKTLIKKFSNFEIPITPSDDDDEDYAAVDLISDSEGDDPNVEKLEEQMIMDEEAFVGRSSFSSFGSGIADLEQGMLLSDLPCYDLQFSWDEQVPLSPGSMSRMNGDCIDLKRPESSSRRVHFEDELTESESADSDESGLRSDIFPDIFIEANSFRVKLEDDEVAGSPDNLGSRSQLSFWDLQNGEVEFEASKWRDTESEASSFRGFDSEAGDTTDEDLPVPATVNKPSTALTRRQSSSSSDIKRTSASSQRAVAASSRRKGPVMATWVIDPKQAVAVIDSSGKRMMLIPGRSPQGDANTTWNRNSFSSGSSISQNSPQSAFRTLTPATGDRGDEFQSVTSPVEVMMSGVFRTPSNPDVFIGSQSFAQQESIYMSEGLGAELDTSGPEEEGEDGEESDGETLLNIEDFIDFGDDSDDSDVEKQNEETIHMTDLPATPISADAKSSPTAWGDEIAGMDTGNMLSHLSQSNVTAFRRHQHNYRRFSGLPQHPALRASVMDGNAIRAGKGAAAKVPITPLRGKKVGKRAIIGQRSHSVSTSMASRSLRR